MGLGRLLRLPGAGVSLWCDLNKRLAFQGNGFLICEIVRESQDWGSSLSLEMLGGGGGNLVFLTECQSSLMS